MFKNVLVEEKWKTQKKFAQAANHNIKVMMDNTEKIVDKMIKEHKIKLKVADIKPTKNINFLINSNFKASAN